MAFKHDKAYKRYKTEVHINRKKYIVNNCWGLSRGFIPNILIQPHRLSKGKVHCSCPMCAQKTKKNGWKHGDEINLEKGLETEEDASSNESYNLSSNTDTDRIVYSTSISNNVNWDELLNICDEDQKEKEFAEAISKE